MDSTNDLRRLLGGSITDVPGIRVGVVTDPTAMTGVTVVIPEGSALATVDVRGGAPGTLGTDSLRPTASNSAIHALVLTGGSLYGLASVQGVMRYLEERGIGARLRVGVVPIVPAAVILDFGVGDPAVRPTVEWGYEAAATAGEPVPEGSIGAGAGARVGKWLGGRHMKSGQGTASLQLAGGIVIGALAVVNAIGDAVSPVDGRLYAAGGVADLAAFARFERFDGPGGFVRISAPGELGAGPIGWAADVGTPATEANASLGGGADVGSNTTLAVIATNARLDKAQLAKVAELAQTGTARAIRPVHCTGDGDTVFALSVGGDTRRPVGGIVPGVDVDVVGAAAADVLAAAIANAVIAAESVPGWPSYRDLLAAGTWSR